MTKLFTDRQWEFLYELHCQGYTYIELANWLDIYPGTIQHNFYRLGLKISDRVPLEQYTARFVALGGEPGNV